MARPVFLPPVRHYETKGGLARFAPSVVLRFDPEDLDLEASRCASTFAADLARELGLEARLEPDLSARPPAAEVPGAPVPLVIQLRRGDADGKTGGPAREAGSHALSLSLAGLVLEAADADGLFWATRTALQLLAQGRLADGSLGLEPCAISDSPAWPLRGLMLDSGRHFHSVDFIKAWLRRMADLKMNWFHWHLSEWNGFRFGSEAFPGLATPGAHYTKDEMRDIVALARDLRITIVPELDVPGRAKAMIDYDPALNFPSGGIRTGFWDFTGRPGRDWHLDPTSEHVRDFLRVLVHEMCEVFPGPFFHIGTDEYVRNPLKLAMIPEFRAWKRARGLRHLGDVWVDFINWLDGVVRSEGRVTRLWNWWETGAYWDPSWISAEVRGGVEYDVWLGSSAKRLAASGARLVNCNGAATYLTPGLGVEPDLAYLCGSWTPMEFTHGKPLGEEYRSLVRGSKLHVWADKAEGRPDEWFGGKMALPLAALAANTWGGGEGGGSRDGRGEAGLREDAAVLGLGKPPA